MYENFHRAKHRFSSWVFLSFHEICMHYALLPFSLLFHISYSLMLHMFFLWDAFSFFRFWFPTSIYWCMVNSCLYIFSFYAFLLNSIISLCFWAYRYISVWHMSSKGLLLYLELLSRLILLMYLFCSISLYVAKYFFSFFLVKIILIIL